MGSARVSFTTIDVEKDKFNELICAGDDECAAYAAAPNSKTRVKVSAVETASLNATWPQAESLAVVRQFKVKCRNYRMVWNPVVVSSSSSPPSRARVPSKTPQHTSAMKSPR
ncbi:hypothetical protein JL722_5372 [Aureococcus anophagefferens]|nr:hypothetical protein JL722_5372 [Aureococcus anophagefferens]